MKYEHITSMCILRQYIETAAVLVCDFFVDWNFLLSDFWYCTWQFPMLSSGSKIHTACYKLYQKAQQRQYSCSSTKHLQNSISDHLSRTKWNAASCNIPMPRWPAKLYVYEYNIKYNQKTSSFYTSITYLKLTSYEHRWGIFPRLLFRLKKLIISNMTKMTI